MVAQKLRQTVDAMFDVHDPGDAQLQGRIRKIAEAARQARASAQSVRTVVHDEYPLGPLSLTADLEAAERSAASIAGALARIDAERSSRQGATRWLREELRAAQIVARDARLRVGNRESLLDRLAVLRGQYADDKKKLMFLREAERIFDPLRVVTCPACLSALDVPPSVVDEKWSMCGESIDSEDVHLSLGMAARAIEASKSDADNDTVGQSDAASEGEDSIIEIAETIDELVNAHGLNESVELIERELKATTRRLDDLNQYWVRLDDDLNVLRNIQLNADAEAEAAAEAVNRVADLPAPYLAERDELSRQLADARLRVQHLQTGVRLWDRVDAANLQADQLEGQASRLRKERREAAERPDRRAVISKLSARFGAILSEIGYPKLSEPLIDERLIPSVRGLPYRAASSGGLTLISIAWSLAIWEVAYEESAKGPGLLMIDSPQKNLGHRAHPDDQDFADSRLVENFYRHVKAWLAGAGVGAQLVVWITARHRSSTTTSSFASRETGTCRRMDSSTTRLNSRRVAWRCDLIRLDCLQRTAAQGQVAPISLSSPSGCSYSSGSNGPERCGCVTPGCAAPVGFRVDPTAPTLGGPGRRGRGRGRGESDQGAGRARGRRSVAGSG